MRYELTVVPSVNPTAHADQLFLDVIDGIAAFGEWHRLATVVLQCGELDAGQAFLESLASEIVDGLADRAARGRTGSASVSEKKQRDLEHLLPLIGNRAPSR